MKELLKKLSLKYTHIQQIALKMAYLGQLLETCKPEKAGNCPESCSLVPFQQKLVGLIRPHSITKIAKKGKLLIWAKK